MTTKQSHKKVQQLIRHAMIATSVVAISGAIIAPKARAVTANNTTVTIDASNTITGGTSSVGGGSTLIEDEGVSATHGGSITMTGSTVAIDLIENPDAVGNARFYPKDHSVHNWDTVKYAGVNATGTGSIVNGSGVTIGVTQATNGLVSALNGGQVNISNSNITGNLADTDELYYYWGLTPTSGVGIQTVLSQGADSNVTLKNDTITTNGADYHYHSAGITAQLEGTVTLGGTITVNSHGDKTYGITAEGWTTGGTITTDPNNALTLVVTTDGDNSPGIYAGNGDTSANVTFFSSIDLNGTNRANSSVTTTGVNSDGVQIDNGASVTLHNITINANDPSSAAVHFTGDQSGTFIGDTVTLNGDIASDDTGDNTVNLQNNSIFNGAAVTNGTGTLAFSLTGSTWNLNNDSTVNNLTNDGSQIIFNPNTFHTLTIKGQYQGVNNGSILMNTQLGDDNSSTDQLIIDGGSATGTTGIFVNQNGGSGAPTTGNGITLVDAINGGTTGATAFALQNTTPLKAGLYEYKLYRGGLMPNANTDNDFFLRSNVNDEATSAAATPAAMFQAVLSMLPNLHDIRPTVEYFWNESINGNSDHNDKEKNKKNALAPVNNKANAQNVSLRNDYGAPTLQNALYHPDGGAQVQHVAYPGDHVNAARRDAARKGIWARLVGQDFKYQTHSGAAAGFDGNIWGVQAGIDLYSKVTDNNSRKFAGVYFTNADASGDSINDAGKVGSVDLDATSVGLYYTKTTPKGWYFNGLAQYSWIHNVNIQTDAGSADPKGSNVTLSAEVGEQLNPESSYIVEPQFQLIYSHNTLDDVEISGTNIQIADVNAVTGRIGLRLLKNPQSDSHFLPWVSANLWNTFGGSSQISSGGSTLSAPVGGTVGELSVGFSTRPGSSSGWSISGSVGGLFGFGGEHYSGIKGHLGLRKGW